MSGRLQRWDGGVRKRTGYVRGGGPVGAGLKTRPYVLQLLVRLKADATVTRRRRSALSQPSARRRRRRIRSRDRDPCPRRSAAAGPAAAPRNWRDESSSSAQDWGRQVGVMVLPIPLFDRRA